MREGCGQKKVGTATSLCVVHKMALDGTTQPSICINPRIRITQLVQVMYTNKLRYRNTARADDDRKFEMKVA